MDGFNSLGWSLLDQKRFEAAILTVPEGSPNRWAVIASMFPGTTPFEVKRLYDELVRDVNEIEAGRVDPPRYVDEDPSESGSGQISFGLKPTKHVESERKKGTPWTEEEHRLFLIGLDRFGKGDWRSISRNVVVTRTPTQVASHAQKYFLRQNSGKKERKRSSIHDITTVGTSPLPVAQSVNQNQNWVPPQNGQVVHQQMSPELQQQLPQGSVQQFPVPTSLPDQLRPFGYQNFGHIL